MNQKIKKFKGKLLKIRWGSIDFLLKLELDKNDKEFKMNLK